MTNLQEMSVCYYIIKSVRGFVHRSCFLSDMHESAFTANHNHQSLNHAMINQVNSLVSHVRIWFAENKKHCNVNFHQQCFIVVVLHILHAVVLKLVVSVCIKILYNNNMVMCRYLLLQWSWSAHGVLSRLFLLWFKLTPLLSVHSGKPGSGYNRYRYL